MQKKLLIFSLVFFLFIVNISSVSALEFDNVKTYDSVTREVTITNAFGLGADIGKARLNTPLNVHVGLGYQKVAEFDIWAYTDYNDIIKSIDFYDKNKVDWEKNKFTRDFDIKYKSYENVLVDDYENKIISYMENGTAIYNYEKVGSHIEKQEVWQKVTNFCFV